MDSSVKKLANRYALYGCMFAALLGGAANLLSLTAWSDVYLWPTVIGGCFSIVMSIAIAMLWRWVARSHREYLITFYTSVSGFRMLAALLTLAGCYIAVGRDAMAPYVVIFMTFYLVGLLHHALYFSRITNKIN